MNVKIKNLYKKFENKIAVNGINFNISENSTLGLLGPNGCGKTTTIGMILGLIKPSKGEIYIDGLDINKNDRIKLLEKINFASPYIELPKKLTVRQNLEIFARLYGVRDIENSIDQIANDLDLKKFIGKKTGELSSGQKTRVSLAKALINKPEILLLDEPTASLDPIVSEYLRNFIYKYKKENNISLLFSSHNMQEAQRLCDKIIILKKGRIIEQGTISNILNKYKEEKLEDVYFKIFGEK